MLKEIIYNDLMARGKTEAVAREWAAVAGEFEKVCNAKESYTRADIASFLAHLRNRGLLQSTINKDLKAIKLLAEIQHWEQGQNGKDFPTLSLKRVSPDEISRPIIQKKDIAATITMGRSLLTPPELCYLALATTYGLRRVEMTRLKDSDFTPGTVTIHTAKGGRKTTHLVPPEIAPALSGFKPYRAETLTHMFHHILVKTGLKAAGGFGWHSVRRALATELILADASSLNVLRFMRWSDASARGEFGMLAIYAKRNQERIDKEIFKIHPFLPFWGSSNQGQIQREGKLKPLIDLIESGELDEEDIEHLLMILRQRGNRN